MKSSRIIIGKFLIVALLTSVFFGLKSYAFVVDRDEIPAATFAKCWDYPTSPDLSIAIDSDSENVYYIDTDRKLSAVDIAAGIKLWSSELAGDPVSNVLVTHGLVLIASQASADKAVLRAVSRTTGITQWSADLPSAASLALGSLNGTVVALSSAGTASAFHADRGAPAWTKKVGAAVTTGPYFHGRTLIVGTDKKELLAITIPGGESVVITKLDGAPTAIFSDDTNSILVGDDRGNLIRSSFQGKREWRFRNGARISSIAGYDSEYLATSHDNFLYKLTRSGNVEWKRRLSARIDKRPIILGKSAIVSTVGDGTVYVIDLTNGKIANRIETGDETSVQIARGENGFAIISTKGLALYSRQPCTDANKKTVPDPAPSREKS